MIVYSSLMRSKEFTSDYRISVSFAKKLSKARGAEIYRTRDGLFDTAETFRIDILDDVFAAYEM